MKISLILVVVGFFGLVISGCAPNKADQDRAITLAQEVYDQKNAGGMDFSNGPCLSDDLMDDWVADIVHDPRTVVDDLPESQCPSYGKTASHFVELDLNGEVVRVK